MKPLKVAAAIFFVAAICAHGADRINQEGRILGPLPTVSAPTLFNTPAADAVLSAMQIFPRDNPWNEDISRRPILSNSDAMIAQIIADLRSDRRTLRAFAEMNFVLVPDNQPRIPISFLDYPDESDPSPYPIPSNLPVETWPRETGPLTLSEWQRDINGDGGDRHAIMAMPGAGFIWETWQTRVANGAWEASNGAKFNLNSNSLRPAGWTSGDAAGLPMFPALLRFDECERGMVEHAMRIIVKRTRVGPIYPATHQASVGNLTDPNIPAMGQRLRLKAQFTVPSTWTKQEKAILLGLKKYGAIVADNGNFFSISVTPDDRYPADAFDHLSTIAITNFEVIQTTAPTEGPRSPGAPQVEAGPDQTPRPGEALQLLGTVTNNTPLVRTAWKQYSGPASTVFTDPSRTNSTVSFPAPGEYILMLSADDGTHAVAYDTLHIAVSNQLTVQIARSNSELILSWNWTTPCVIEASSNLSPPQWLPVVTNSTGQFRAPLSNQNFFYRLRASP
ncbi:MAG TPA: hypothetical protein VK633_13730 [Verrucomicrobiae bacterium]|nr:hypothetical protein [Verrucomicrobiae bacterium]